MVDTQMQDAEAAAEEQMMYGHGRETEEELAEKYPHRPHNHSKTLPFHDLYLDLFNPLKDIRKKPTGPLARRKHGPHSGHLSPNEMKNKIITDFIQKWRKEVGNDFYPAMRLMIPDKDRDRAMYGLKEKIIGKLLVRVIRIDKDSEDGQNLLNWKLPGLTSKSSMAGDFAGRCFEVISKRPIRTTPGNMTVAEVNAELDKLSLFSKEEDQLPIFENFYRNMNAEELMWLVRIILRQIHIGATERSILERWHIDAENLFNVSSSLRRVCWELSDPSIRLDGESSDVTLMQCFQPQLAAFQMSSFEKMIAKLQPSEGDDVFWIQDKLDGERMQLHMVEDASVPGGKRFVFWSRKAKDYTSLYGKSFEDMDGALTKHLKPAFHEGVRNIILDGEMIYWNMEEDKAGSFGHLKTAVRSELLNPSTNMAGDRPVYKVFDCLYLNDKSLTKYTLRDRRNALNASITNVPLRMEILGFTEGRTPKDIEERLREVVEQSWEGLVLKNPRSRYSLNNRNDDWIKVKPEYMSEYGEALDCVIIGGYYGSGTRGGNLSSFLCGLRMNPEQIKQGANPQKCFSFFKVGGGFTMSDYADIRHRTEGKWIKWDPKNPPTKWIELGGNQIQACGPERAMKVKFSDADAKLLRSEQPDMWIKPEDSVVIEVKAATVHTTSTFRVGYTLRFPRFKRLRTDKDWSQALSIREFEELRQSAKEQKSEKEFQIDQSRKAKKVRTNKKKPLTIAGSESVETPYAGPDTKIFEGLTFFIITESLTPVKHSKSELEQIVKSNGGNIVQKENPDLGVICVADRRLVKTASILKQARENIVRPSWILDCVKLAETDRGRPAYVLPMEPRHMFFMTEDNEPQIAGNVDEYGDSWAMDITTEDLKGILAGMPSKSEGPVERERLLDQLEDMGGTEDLKAWMFSGLVAYFDNKADDSTNGEMNGTVSEDLDLRLEEQKVRFAGGRTTQALEDRSISHVVVGKHVASSRLKDIRAEIARRSPVPRIVTFEWVESSWREGTLLDAERFTV